MKVSVHDTFLKLQSNGKLYALTVVAAVFVMAAACVAVFSVNVKGAERVMVPNVTGKALEDALLELQAKELYARIQLRYSESADDKGKILEQNPAGGAIRKGYSRVSLVVSRGAVIDKIENYIGQNIDETRMKMQTLFAGQPRPLIVIAEPMYEANVAPQGTILEQDPPEGTPVYDQMPLRFVVSRGPEFESAVVPDLAGLSIEEMLRVMERTRLTFDFTARPAAEGEKPGSVALAQNFDGAPVKNYTRVAVEMALPSGPVDGIAYGIFNDTLTEYPYPVTMSLMASSENEEPRALVTFTHKGGSLTIPYAVPVGTELSLRVAGKETKKIVAR